MLNCTNSINFQTLRPLCKEDLPSTVLYPHKQQQQQQPLFYIHLGGHVNTYRAYYECDASETIHYKDIVSLYPYIMITVKYPVGTPCIKKNPSIQELSLDSCEQIAVAIYKAEFLAPTDRTFYPLFSIITFTLLLSVVPELTNKNLRWKTGLCSVWEMCRNKTAILVYPS